MDRDLYRHFEHFHIDDAVLSFLDPVESQSSRSRRARRDQLAQLQSEVLARSANVLQDCLSGCHLEPQLRFIVINLLQDVCATTLEPPESYLVSHVDRGRRVAASGVATVYQGLHKGRVLTIREFHPPDGGDWDSEGGRYIIRLILHEVVLHWQLRHRNIAQLLGFQRDLNYGTPAVITTQAKYPSALLYLREHPGRQSFVNVILGACAGLTYLHTYVLPVVHGDLHPRNVAVDEHGVVTLCSYGFIEARSEITEAYEIKADVQLRYVAPECDLGLESSKFTTHSDIYSLAMVIYTLGTHQSPFAEENDWRAAEDLRTGKRPVRPADLGRLDNSAAPKLWELLTRMWLQDPRARPAMSEVQQRMGEILVETSSANDTNARNKRNMELPRDCDPNGPLSYGSDSTLIERPVWQPPPAADRKGQYCAAENSAVQYSETTSITTKGKSVVGDQTLSSLCSAETPSPLLIDKFYSALIDPRSGLLGLAESQVIEIACHLRAGSGHHRFILVHVRGAWIRLEREREVRRSSQMETSGRAVDNVYLSDVRGKLESSSDTVELQCSFASLQVYHLIECTKLAHDASPEQEWSSANCRWFTYVIYSTLTIYATYQRDPLGHFLDNYSDTSDATIVEMTRRVKYEFESRCTDPKTHELKAPSVYAFGAQSSSPARSSMAPVSVYPMRFFRWLAGWGGGVLGVWSAAATAQAEPEPHARETASSDMSKVRE